MEKYLKNPALNAGFIAKTVNIKNMGIVAWRKRARASLFRQFGFFLEI